MAGETSIKMPIFRKMDTGNRKVRDTGFNDLKNDAEEVERASKLVQKDIDLTRRAIEDSGKCQYLYLKQ